jgi:hypothetical protein
MVRNKTRLMTLSVTGKGSGLESVDGPTSPMHEPAIYVWRERNPSNKFTTLVENSEHHEVYKGIPLTIKLYASCKLTRY